MATPQHNGVVDYFNTSVEQDTSRPFQDIANYARRGWELCACCRVTVRKASLFFGQEDLHLREQLSCDHYRDSNFC